MIKIENHLKNRWRKTCSHASEIFCFVLFFTEKQLKSSKDPLNETVFLFEIYIKLNQQLKANTDTRQSDIELRFLISIYLC